MVERKDDMDAATVNKVFKVRYGKKCEELGVGRLTFEQEVELSNWYKAEMEKLKVERERPEIEERVKVKVEKVTEVRRAGYEVIECRVCGEAVERTGGRGRPRVVHDGRGEERDCKGEKVKMKLRRRGTWDE